MNPTQRHLSPAHVSKYGRPREVGPASELTSYQQDRIDCLMAALREQDARIAALEDSLIPMEEYV